MNRLKKQLMFVWFIERRLQGFVLGCTSLMASIFSSGIVLLFGDNVSLLSMCFFGASNLIVVAIVRFAYCEPIKEKMKQGTPDMLLEWSMLDLPDGSLSLQEPRKKMATIVGRGQN